MKFQPSELPIGKPQPRRKASKLAPLIALTIVLTIPLYYPFLSKDSTKKLPQPSPIYQDLEDSITLPSHAEPPPIETIIQPCSAASGQCNSGGDAVVDQNGGGEAVVDQNGGGEAVVDQNGGGEAVVDHHVRKKRDKLRRKRNRKRQPVISRSDDQINSNVIGTSSDRGMIRSQLIDDEQCDLFSGQWVPNPDGPYYTNETCDAIQEHQNCLKFGRPDTGFLKWRWKPDDCELPMFDANQFLELVRGKSIAFVGDSVARNHMQSLICLLSRVAKPVDLSGPVDQNKRYEYRDHDFNISMFWSPYLVKTSRTDPIDEKQPFNLHLDEFDLHWTTKIALFDYLIISAGHWFFRPTYFYLDRRLAGCIYCADPNVPHLTSYFSYRRAFRTAFRAVVEANFSGVAFLRTFAPSHFEGAAWDKGGDCPRTRPYGRGEAAMEDYSREMYLIQLEELRIAQRAGRRIGGNFRLFDATGVMMLRPDGHPSKYGHWQGANQTFANDCVHWCLPGPIDSWNDFLQELLKREIEDSSER